MLLPYHEVAFVATRFKCRMIRVIPCFAFRPCVRRLGYITRGILKIRKVRKSDVLEICSDVDRKGSSRNANRFGVIVRISES
jgi:hypothetical protein